MTLDRLIYEVIPPPQNWSQEKTELWTAELLQLLDQERIKTINLPEVVCEKRDHMRTVPYLDKLDNITYTEFLLAREPSLIPIPNKITVRLPEKEFLAWVDTLYQKGIRQLILVGGEKSHVRYPGLSVLQAAALIKKRYPDLLLGAVTIFTRQNEPQRILEKISHGVDFFVSQIIYETANMKCVLLNLGKLCKGAGCPLPRIYLSLAAAEKKSDIAFMQWLGVEFPTAIYSYFSEGEEESIADRVFEVLGFVLEELRFFIAKKKFDIGFNVEQIMYFNQESAKQLIRLVKQIV